MKCSKCGEEVNEKGVACPFCGAEVPRAPKTIDEFLKEFVEDRGPSIFREENSSRLERAMGDWPEIYADDRDVIKLLQIKNIPDRLISALDLPSEKQGAVVQESANILCEKFGINGDFAAKMISLITDAIGLKTDVAVGDGRGTFKDPRDGQVYKTCKIGDQVWLAENLKFETDEGCYVYNDDYQYLDKYGYMYSYDALSKAIPEGWHLPTKEEIKAMEKFVIKSNRCKSAIPHLISKDYGETAIDTYGFSLLPGGEGRTPSRSWDVSSQYEGMGCQSCWWLQRSDETYRIGSSDEYDWAWTADISKSPITGERKVYIAIKQCIKGDFEQDKYRGYTRYYIRLIKDK